MAEKVKPDFDKWLRIGNKTINLDAVVAVESLDGWVRIHLPFTSIEFTEQEAAEVITALVAKRGLPHPDSKPPLPPGEVNRHRIN